MMASSSAITTRMVTRWFLGSVLVGRWWWRRSCQRTSWSSSSSWRRSSASIEDDDRLAVGRHRIGVALRLVELDLGHRRLGDQRPDAVVVGLVGELGELLVDDAQLLAQGPQAGADPAEPTFDEPVRHAGECRRGLSH